jgi:hypothetical protein
MALELTQPVTEMSTRNLPLGKARPAHEALFMNYICRYGISTKMA